MYRRDVILNPRYKFQSNIAENNVYGINTCSSCIFLKIAMITKLAILYLKEYRRIELLKRIENVTMPLLIYINISIYIHTQAQFTLRKALKSNDQITEAAISPRFVFTLHFSHLAWGKPRSNPSPKQG